MILSGLIGCTLLICSAPQAVAVSVTPAITLPAVQYGSSFGTQYWDGTGFVSTGGLITGPSGSTGSSSATTGLSSFSSSLTPMPSITASSLAASTIGFHGADAFALFTVDYFFYVDGPVTGATIPVTVRATAASTVTGTGGTGFASEALVVRLADPLFSGPSLSRQGASFSVNDALTVFVGTPYVYGVHMTVQTRVIADGTEVTAETATGSLDPIFTIDLPDADQYRIFFSDGVGNGELTTPAATPLPAALPLFAGGAGMTALVGRMRRRKTAN